MARRGARFDCGGTPGYVPSGRLTCSGPSTCARDPAPRTAPFGKRNSNSAWGHERPSLGDQSSQAACRSGGEKTLCSVTTVGLNLALGRRGSAPLTPLPLGSGMLRFDIWLAPPLCLALAGLPSMHEFQALTILAIALVPAARLEGATAVLAQASTRWETTPSGVHPLLGSTLTRTHGRYHSQRLTRGGGVASSSGLSLSKLDQDDVCPNIGPWGGRRHGSRRIF